MSAGLKMVKMADTAPGMVPGRPPMKGAYGPEPVVKARLQPMRRHGTLISAVAKKGCVSIACIQGWGYAWAMAGATARGIVPKQRVAACIACNMCKCD